MKTPDPSQNNKPSAPSLFHIAALLDNAAPAPADKFAPQPGRTGLADMMLHPEKLEKVLKAAAIKAGTSRQSRHGRATRSAPRKKRDGNSAGKPAGQSPGQLKKIDFFLEAPSARTVKLVGDFTEWEKFPHEMIRSENGVWHAAVALPPGHHSYRYLADGQWCDDPHPALRVPNPFGTLNAVAIVI